MRPLLKDIISNFSGRASHLPSRPFIIAEAGVNHEGDIEIAKRLINEAAEGGADAIKFQTYKASKIASKHSPSYWDLSQESTDSQYKLFQKYDKFWKSEYEQLAKECDNVGIEFLSTPFDTDSAVFLNQMMDVFKISSSDLNNRPFIEYLCQFDKPIILSTGASYLWEIDQALSWISPSNIPVALLHCILNYPTLDENANLSVITTLIKKYPDLPIGYSDHTLPKDMATLEVATLLGAIIIEKHFTFDKSLPGNDHYHSMDSNDLRIFRSRVEKLNKLLGTPHRVPLQSENISRLNARRSLVSNGSISKGEFIKPRHLTFKRPGTGISPVHYHDVVGRVAQIDIADDTTLTWSMLGDHGTSH